MNLSFACHAVSVIASETERMSAASRFFLNGVEQGATQTASETFHNGAAAVNVGRHGDNINYFKGYISNLRLVIDSAVYTSTFTPPTEPLEPVAGTSLLTLRGPSFTDDSSNRLVITRNGDTKITPFSPFKPHTVTPDSYSVYFDGTGDYLTVPIDTSFTFGTQDFTVEAWVYMNNLHVFALIDTRTTSSTNNWGIFRDVSNGGRIQWNYGSGNYYSTGTDKWSSVGVYQHIVYCRSNGTGYFFVDGELLGTVTDTNNYVSASAAYIGSRYEGTGTIFLNGYIENLQILNGFAKYTGNFTPPTTTQGITYQAP
jgi:hypothetical protein